MFEMFKTKDGPTLGSRYWKWKGELFIGKPEDLGLGSLPDFLLRNFYWGQAERRNLERSPAELDQVEADIVKANIYRIAALPWVNAGAVLGGIAICLIFCFAVTLKDVVWAGAFKVKSEVSSLTHHASKADPKEQANIDAVIQACKTQGKSSQPDEVAACASVGVTIPLVSGNQ